MNDTQWVFETECLQFGEENKVEELKTIMTIVRQSIINMFGLNIMPIEDPETGQLRLMGENEYMPLIFALGSPEVISEIGKKLREYETQEEVAVDKLKVQEMSPEDLDSYIDGDIEFASPEDARKQLIWNSPASKFLRDNFIKDLDEMSGEKTSESDETSDELPAKVRVLEEDG